MKPRSRAGSILALLSLVTAALTACGELLNVDGIRVSSRSPRSGDGGAPRPTCAPGTFRCTGPALQLCDAEERSYRTVRVCSSAELCCDTPERCAEAPGCQAPACLPGEFRCVGAALERCNPGQTGFETIDRCGSALACNASLGRCTEAACDSTQRERQCNGKGLEQCLPGQSEWSPIDSCRSSDLCDPALATGCALPACRIESAASPPSPYLCASGDLMRCNDALTGWEFVETCLNPANCNPLIEALEGDPYAANMPPEQLERLGCTRPGCAPGRYLCDGSALMLCRADRTGYLEIDECETPRHCDASRGRCTPEPCTPGVRQCSGDEYQECTESGWQVRETCPSGAPCDSQRGCLEPACQANEYRCNGAALERCNGGRNGWIPVRACAGPAACNAAAKRCERPVCAAGSVRCTRDGVLESCNAERTGWELVADCAAAAGIAPGPAASALCDPSGAGLCLPFTTCTAGSRRCNGADLEVCRDNGWHPYERCVTPAQCDAAGGACLPAICEPGAFRCSTPADPTSAAPDEVSRLGLVLQECNAAGTGFEPVRACGALELCDAPHGQCDICDPTLPSVCSDQGELLVCTADGQELTLYKLCEQGCVEAGTGDSSRTTCREDLDGAPGGG